MHDTIPPTRNVASLRNTFGDGQPPEISRKIKACVACRKQKIKCHMSDGKPPCARCRHRSLPCTVNRSLQMLMEEDVTWKLAVTKKLQLLQDIVGTLAEKLDLPELQSATQQGLELDQLLKDKQQQQSISDGGNVRPQAMEHSYAVDPECEPSSMPALCISHVADNDDDELASSSSLREPTIVSKGIVSMSDARALFDVYYQRLDHLLYQILGDHTSLDTILESSPLLTAAVCTVAALHSNPHGHLFDPCVAELKQLVSGQLLSRKYNVDDVRGLCIGGFWLSSLSWALSGSAVRVSIEMDLHNAMHRCLEGKRDAYMDTRLYYLVYVCDHHSSVIYGRPPMSRESASTRAAMQLLETEHATEDDVRLVTQVKLWSIYGAIFDCFGTETAKALTATQLVQLRRFGIMLETWYADWKDRFGPSKRVGNYPAKGVGLHFYFAKLYLCSHVFRGLKSGSASQTLLPEQEEIANSAILSATSIINVLTSDVEMQAHLNGLPLCFDMMITFAVIFLLKVTSKYLGSVWIDKTRILDMTNKIIAIMQDVTQNMHPKHLLVAAATGLKKLCQNYKDSHVEMNTAGTGGNGLLQSLSSSSPEGADFAWLQSLNDFDNFDFHTLLSDPGYWTAEANMSA